MTRVSLALIGAAWGAFTWLAVRLILLIWACSLVACSAPASDAQGNPTAETDSGAAAAAEPNPCGLYTTYAGDGACLAPPTDLAVIQLRYGPANYDDPAAVAPYLLAAGAETLTYQIVAAEHPDILVSGYEVSERSGMHHLAFYNGNSGETDAATALINPAIFLTQISHDETDLGNGAPELAGAALHVPAGSFVVAAHAINTSDVPILVEAWVNLRTVESTSKPISPLQFAGGMNMHVPPGTQQTIKASAVAGHTIDILQIVGHFHTHTTEERVLLDGAQVYSTRSWEEPDVAWFESQTTGPLHVPKDGVLSWECDVDNTTTRTIEWANALLTSEMCNVVGYVYGVETWTVRVQ